MFDGLCVAFCRSDFCGPKIWRWHVSLTIVRALYINILIEIEYPGCKIASFSRTNTLFGEFRGYKHILIIITFLRLSVMYSSIKIYPAVYNTQKPYYFGLSGKEKSVINTSFFSRSMSGSVDGLTLEMLDTLITITLIFDTEISE